MALTKASLDRRIGESGGNENALTLYIRDVDGDDANPGDDARPLKTLTEAARRLPTRSKEDIFWHVGPHATTGYTMPKIKDVALDGVFIYILGDGGTVAGIGDTSSHTVIFSGTVDTVSSNDVFTVVGGGLGVEAAYSGKSLRWLSTANGNHATGVDAEVGFNGQMRTVTDHQDDSILLAAPTENTIAPGDTFEIFVPTVFLVITADFEKESSFENVGTRLIPPRSGGDFITLQAFSPDPRAGSGIVLVNIGLTIDTGPLPQAAFAVRNTNLIGYGLQNSVGAGQGDTFGAATALVLGANSTFQFGFDGVTNAGLLGSVRAAESLGLSSPLAWVGWGAGLVEGDPTAFPSAPQLTVVLDGSVLGFMYGAFEVINSHALFVGNTHFEPSPVNSALSVGFLSITSDTSLFNSEGTAFGGFD